MSLRIYLLKINKIARTTTKTDLTKNYLKKRSTRKILHRIKIKNTDSYKK